MTEEQMANYTTDLPAIEYQSVRDMEMGRRVAWTAASKIARAAIRDARGPK